MASAELYNPITGTWSLTGSMHAARIDHTATRLANGEVLVAGGFDHLNGYLASAEVYNPVTGQWHLTGSMHTPRQYHKATRLVNGLVAGGDNQYIDTLASAELYNPSTGTWSSTGSMNDARDGFMEMQLKDGRVLAAGGYGHNSGGFRIALASAELYDPSTGTWSYTGSMNYARVGTKAVRLANGEVLVFGGYDEGTSYTSAELFM